MYFTSSASGLSRRYINIILYIRKNEAAIHIQRWWKKVVKRLKSPIVNEEIQVSDAIR